MGRPLSLLRDCAGMAAVELALAAPILAAVVLGLIDISTSYSEKMRLEQIAHRTIERVQVSQFKTSMETTLETEAQTEAGTGSTADLTYWLECNGTKMTATSAWAAGCAPTQIIGRYVQVDVQKPHTPMFFSRWAGSNTNGSIVLHGVAGVRIQ